MWLLTFVFLFKFFVPTAPIHQQRIVRVGVYQNPPKVFLDSHARARGIFIDILEDIARTQGWQLEYRPDTWNALLECLEKGELDIVPDVAYSVGREERFRLGRTWVLESWADVYSLETKRISSIQDLEGRRLAVLAGSIQEEFLNRLQRMGIRPHQLSLPDYQAMIQAVQENRADALVASRFFYFSKERPAHIVPNRVMIEPGGLYFAFCKKGCEKLADIVDQAVACMKDDPSSIWYSSQARWLDRTLEVPQKTPTWLRVLGVVIVNATVLLVVFVVLLRLQVRRRTHQLQEANAQLLRMNRELEETLIALRHSQAEKEQLDREMDRVRQLETLGQLTGGIAHDFNNQLLAIGGLSELILSELPPDSPAVADVQTLQETVNRGTALTQQLLAFASRQPTQPQWMDINVAIHALIKMLRQLVGSRITLRFEAGQNLPSIYMDPSQFDQIVTNLVINARDAVAESGNIVITTSFISCETDSDSKNCCACVRLEVTDDGCGIPPGILDRIFEPFFTTKAEGKGTGLGLSTVFGIVRRHGGFIRVQSRPRKTTFMVDFPVTSNHVNDIA